MTKQHGRGRLLRLWHARCLCRAPGGLRPPSAKLTAWGRQAGSVARVALYGFIAAWSDGHAVTRTKRGCACSESEWCFTLGSLRRMTR